MSQIFVSYSSKDLPLVEDLSNRLRQLNFDVLRDTVNIYPLDDWRHRIEQLIIEASLVVFIATKDSNDSEVCKWELETATLYNKKIAPIAFNRNDLKSLPQPIRWINGVVLRVSDVDVALRDLARDWSLDLDWCDKHAFLSVRADRWQRANNSDHYLLRGLELLEARKWVANRPWGVPPKTTDTQRVFLNVSAREESVTLTAKRVLFFVAFSVVALTLLKIFHDPVASSDIERGRRLLLRGDDAGAMAQFNDALKRDPTANKRIDIIRAEASERKEAALERAKAIAPVLGELAGLSANAAARELNARGVRTATGKPWSAMTVIRAREQLAQ